MLKKSASGVLAALRGSTYQSVRLASSLAAALLDGHFEHPVFAIRNRPETKKPEVQVPSGLGMSSCARPLWRYLVFLTKAL